MNNARAGSDQPKTVTTTTVKMMPGMGMGMPQQNAAAGGAPASAPTDTGKTVNLNDKINKAECYARNVSSQFPISNLFIGDTR